jgi:hypothetical protein
MSGSIAGGVCGFALAAQIDPGIIGFLVCPIEAFGMKSKMILANSYDSLVHSTQC